MCSRYSYVFSHNILHLWEAPRLGRTGTQRVSPHRTAKPLSYPCWTWCSHPIFLFVNHEHTVFLPLEASFFLGEPYPASRRVPSLRAIEPALVDEGRPVSGPLELELVIIKRFTWVFCATFFSFRSSLPLRCTQSCCRWGGRCCAGRCSTSCFPLEEAGNILACTLEMYVLILLQKSFKNNNVPA